MGGDVEENNPYLDTRPEYDIFLDMVREYMDKVRSGDMHKGQLIGMYNQTIKKSDFPKELLSKLKYPQFVSINSNDRSDNWLDFIISMEDDVYEEFKRGLSD